MKHLSDIQSCDLMVLLFALLITHHHNRMVSFACYLLCLSHIVTVTSCVAVGASLTVICCLSVTIDAERDSMFKLIPHCAKGSWIITQSVGTTPVILGRKLATFYHLTERYMEVDIDVTTNPAVSYIVKMVQVSGRG